MEVLELPLQCGKVALIDATDAPLINEWRWSWDLNSNGYVASRKHLGGGRQKWVTLHRLLLDFPACEIDHANRNKLDNRRSNLRPCTQSQNQANREPLPHSSRFKGVTIQSRTGKFESQVWFQNKRIYLGTFATEEAAARAYDAAALERFGEFALLNFPIN